MSKFTFLVIALSGITFLASGGYSLIPRVLYDPTCNIKGNISADTHAHIYHVPGQQYYRETKISLRHGERWLYTENDAQAAGWRKANF